ncbi:MAG: metallophosphoesterase family protein [Lacipirellulaceae bacterium]
MATTTPLRLVHASDLRLDSPLAGLAEVPDLLRPVLRDAARTAAERVFDTALAENADALLLSGDVIDLRQAAPRDLVFLVDQFGRLDKRGVAVFWGGGRIDPPEAWPRTMRLPENVTLFPTGRVGTHELKRSGATVAIVQGTSRPADRSIDTSGFHRDGQGRFTIGVAYGSSESAGKEGDRVDYMALGGRSRRATVDHSPGVAHYPGAPQGLQPTELGPSGCTVVSVESDGKAKTRFVATDPVRWQEESVEFTAGSTEAELRARLRERLDKTRTKAGGIDLLVSWRLHGVGPLVPHLRADGLCAELLADLQAYAGRQQPVCWSWRVACDDPYDPPHEQRDQETILGDLLRQVEVLGKSEAFILDIAGMLPKPLPDPALAAVAKPSVGAERQDLLQRAAKLGVALMTTEA